MRIGVVSDVHSNVPALEAALARFEDHGVDEVWCAGDIVFEYRFSDGVVQLLRDVGATAILGNHDMVMIGPLGERARANAGADELAWLAALEPRHEAVHDGHRIRMVHGSPWEPYGDYLLPRNPQWERADELGVDILVVGHTHVPMAQRFGTTLVVNPGSVGDPRQADRRGSYAVIDTATATAEIGHVT